MLGRRENEKKIILPHYVDHVYYVKMEETKNLQFYFSKEQFIITFIHNFSALNDFSEYFSFKDLNCVSAFLIYSSAAISGF